MFKWTNLKEIKKIFIDKSIDKKYLIELKETLFEYSNIIEISYIPDYEVNMYDFLCNNTGGKISSDNIIIISNCISVCKTAFSYKIGTIYLYNEILINENSSLPDICLRYRDIKKLNKYIKQDMFYIAEFLTINSNSIQEDKGYILSSFGVVVNNKEFKCNVFILGRYYPTNRYSDYSDVDSLSRKLLKFKNKPNDKFYEAYKVIIKAINDRNKVDLVTYVPLKIGEEKRFDRFKDMTLESGITYKSIFKNIKKYENKASATISEREENVKDAYIILEGIDVSNKHIILIDDIRTSGVTTNELVSLLYKNNAKEVSVIVLASNQRLDIGVVRFFQCEECGKNMRVLINNKTNDLFWSCNSRKCKTLNYLEGLSKFKKANSRVFKYIVDTEF